MDKSIILKSFDDAIVKCKNSSYLARKIGNSVQHNLNFFDEKDGVKMDIETFTYDNGMSITLIHNLDYQDYGDGKTYQEEWWDIGELNDNGVKYTMLDDQSYDFFEYQKDYIIKNYGKDGWDFFSKYANVYASYEGMNLNGFLRGVINKEDINNNDGEFYISDFLMDNHERFVDMLKNIPADNKSFMSCRVVSKLHNNDSISKKIVSDKGHTSTSLNENEDYYSTFADTDGCWKIFTIVNEGSGVNAGFLGSAIQDIDGYDWEREVNFAPDQKFERLVIDEENGIIIQKPIPIK